MTFGYCRACGIYRRLHVKEVCRWWDHNGNWKFTVLLACLCGGVQDSYTYCPEIDLGADWLDQTTNEEMSL